MIDFLKYKRKIIITTLLIILTLSVAGCNLTKTKLKNPSISEINEKISQAVDLSTLKVGNYAKFRKLYAIQKGDMEDFVLYRAPSNIKADEIVIIKVKASNQVNNVKEKVLKRVDKQAASFIDYLPDEYFLIEKKVLKVKNNYILLAISKDAEKIAKEFEESFK